MGNLKHADAPRESLEREMDSLKRLLEKQKEELDRCSDAMRSLRESEENFRALAQTTSAIIFFYQGESLVYVNRAAERVTGYSKDELLKMKFWEIIRPDYQKRVREYCLARQRGEQVPSPHEAGIITKGGEMRWVEITAERITYTGKPAGMATFFDITDRKHAEEKMRLIQFAIDNFMDSSIWLNLEGQIIYANKATCQSLGYSADELLSMRIWDIYPDCPYERFLERWNKAKRSGAFNFQSMHVRKDGSAFPVEVSANYLKFENKEYLITFARDITIRKQYEEALSDANAQTEFYLDLMGHDINNLNQVALGYLELADDAIRSGGKLGEDDIGLIEKPMVSLKGSSRLIDKVMRLRRLKSKELILEQVDICSVLSRLKDKYSHVPGRNVAINYTPSAECLVVANELIDEIFINLIENSIKHSPVDRPLIIDILQAMAREDGKAFIRVTIEDNGPGIPDDEKEKLFTRFYRGKTLAKGKGLGLYLARTLAENFGGKIRVEDRVPGDYTKGVRFIVMLPAARK
ncbi:PAS domain S-box protein [Methanocella conradii]|uniref:PAS domain S-box protein n=1 Tax=Methanocella conradii TaxID=1175444 RepID=UPI0024B33590|nr:PAS domain S-box protein [Methanocella conradii]MDI6895797.1 PAS domain S-box protein [Methanocella conradii]